MSEQAAALTVSELAKRSRAPVSTIKFYLREGLLPAGDLEAKHRAFYGPAHLRRLHLIQVLRDVAGLAIPAIRDICNLLDDKGEHDLSLVIARVIDALGRRGPVSSGREVGAARQQVSEMLRARGVHVRGTAKAVADLAGALVGLRRTLGSDLSADVFVPYLNAMCALAEQDFETNKYLVSDAASAAVGATYGTVLWEPILLVLRRIAYEHVAVKTFGRQKRHARKGA